MSPLSHDKPDPLDMTSTCGIHQLFSYHAKIRPNNFAVRDEQYALTYAELEAASDKWCAGLRDAGVAQGDVIAISLPRGQDLIAAILGVLKCGAVYGVLLPEWPPRRADQAVKTMSARLLIATDLVSDFCLTLTPGEVVSDTQLRKVQAITVNGNDPACVYFTSGTTGEPKCVLTTHGAMTRLFKTHGVLMTELRPVAIPLAAPPAWDAFGFELWAALLTGGVSVVIPQPFLSPEVLRSVVTKNGVNTAWLTSSLFNVLVDEDIDCFTGLRQLFVGGERLSVRHVRQFLLRHPEVRLVNGYGPVESVVFATTRTVRLEDCNNVDGIPIGLPVPGTRVHLLNGDELCTTGSVGEICISGEGLALQYISDSERTKQSFNMVLIDGVTTRVYRTGDRGKQQEDGLIQCLGRNDRQLKVRGIRVEPEEVEKQIEAHQRIRSCRIIARRDSVGSVYDVVAFCIPVSLDDDLDGLHEELARRMAPHHLPGRLAPIVEYPLSPQGKLDEQKLMLQLQTSKPAEGVASDHVQAVGTETDKWTTSTLAAFSSILGLEDVDENMTFFELGGTSLQAARVCARLSLQLGQSVSISDLYSSPTAGELGRKIRTAAIIPPPEDDVIVPLSPMQTVFLTRHLLHGDADQTNICLVVWQVKEELDLDRLQIAIDAVHLRHDNLSAVYSFQGTAGANYPSASLADIDPPSIKVLPQCTTLQDGTRLLRAELGSGLNPFTGHLWRVATTKVESAWLIGCAVHHIAFDGWSEHLLARDISAYYSEPNRELPGVTGLSSRKPPPRHEKRRRSELLQAPPLDWGATPTEMQSSLGPQSYSFDLSPETVSILRDKASLNGHTLFVALLASWVSSLADTTGQEDFCIGIPVSQRDSPGLEHSIGCFMTTVPVRFRHSSVAGDMEAVGRTVTRAFADQDLPLNDLLAHAGTEKSGRSPIFQTLFALQNNPPPNLTLSDKESVFQRQPYFDIPLDLHVEIWPDENGLRVEIIYRPSAVTADIAIRLARRYATKISDFVRNQNT